MTAHSVRPPDRAALSRMEEARRATQRQLDLIERDIARRIAAFVWRRRGPVAGAPRIRPSDATAFRRRYREALAALTAERQSEVDALARKLGRQDRAIDAFREGVGLPCASARAGANSHPTIITESPMPIFTIETTYHLPVFRHWTVEANSIEEACRLAVADDDWEQGKEEHESSGATHVTGIWRGRAAAYAGETLPIPDAFSDSAQLEADQDAMRLALA